MDSTSLNTLSFMIGGITKYLPQNFKHIDKGMDMIEAEDRKGLKYL